ncbi:MAG: Bug family tripartite tricarboxylate transporter substrate binding protein, partial [Burkholderiales bacterium]
MPISHAQTFPLKPITIVSATPTGGGGDTAVRVIAAKMSSTLGKAVVVDTRGSGGAGLVGVGAVGRGSPDGYTLVWGTSGTFVTSRFLFKTMPFDALKEFTPVSLSITQPSFFVAHPSVPANTVRELIDHLRANPGKLAYVSLGVGSIHNLIGESFKQATNTDMLHVPYAATGLSQVWADLIAGRVQIFFPSYANLRQLLPEKKVKALAVMSESRYKHEPNVPAMKEALPDFQTLTSWWGFMAPANLPKTLADRLSTEIRAALTDADSVGKLDPLGIVVVASTPERFASYLKEEIDMVGGLANRLGIKPE